MKWSRLTRRSCYLHLHGQVPGFASWLSHYRNYVGDLFNGTRRSDRTYLRYAIVERFRRMTVGVVLDRDAQVHRNELQQSGVTNTLIAERRLALRTEWLAYRLQRN